VYVQATSFLQKQNAGSGKLLGEGGNSELRMNGVTGAPFLIAQPVRILEDNFPIDSNQNGSPKEVSSGFRANACVFSIEQFRSICLAESARGREGATENQHSECNTGEAYWEGHPEIIAALVNLW
jgi:hypothetical protein